MPATLPRSIWMMLARPPPASRPEPRTARLANVWSGALVCSAFANLHAAKVVLVDLYAEEDIQAAAPGVLARLQACLPSDDDVRQRAEALFGSSASAAPSDTHGQGWPNGENRIQRAERRPLTSAAQAGCSTSDLALRRSSLRDAMQVSYDAADEQYARVRSFRNVLITGAVLLSMLVIAVCLVGARYSKAIPLCSNKPSSTTAAAAATGPQVVCPTSEMADTSAPHGGDVAVVALMGVLGAALSATLSVQKLRGTASPYAVPVALAFFKLPAGALTAIAVLLLIKGDFVPGFSQLDSQGQILAYAIVFGVAQHLVTRFRRPAGRRRGERPAEQGTPGCKAETSQSGSTIGNRRQPGFHGGRLITKGHLPGGPCIRRGCRVGVVLLECAAGRRAQGRAGGGSARTPPAPPAPPAARAPAAPPAALRRHR